MEWRGSLHVQKLRLACLQVHADLAGVGLSIVTPDTEVLYVLLDGIRIRATSSKVSRTVEGCIRSIQACPQNTILEPYNQHVSTTILPVSP